jgi:hypothetical protein
MRKIKSVSRYVAAVSDPNANIEHWTLKTYREIDIEERETLEVHYEPNGELESKTISEYNNEGKIISQKTFISEEEIAEDFSFAYNEDGQLIEKRIHYADGSSSVKTYEHKEKELFISIMDDEGDAEGKEYLRFDENNNLLEESSWDEDDRLLSKNLMQYDDHNNLIMKVEFVEDEEFASKTMFKFDDRGNQIEILSLTRNNEVISKRESVFNEQNLIVEENVDGYVVKYEHDENGRRIRDEVIDPHKNTESFTEYYYEEDDLLEKTISCQKGNLMYNPEPNDQGGKLAAFLVSKYEYEFWAEDH